MLGCPVWKGVQDSVAEAVTVSAPLPGLIFPSTPYCPFSSSVKNITTVPLVGAE